MGNTETRKLQESQVAKYLLYKGLAMWQSEPRSGRSGRRRPQHAYAHRLALPFQFKVTLL